MSESLICIKMIKEFVIFKRSGRMDKGDKPYVVFKNQVKQKEFTNLRQADKYVAGLVAILMLFFAPLARACEEQCVTDSQAIKAIVGEAEGEIYEGKLAVACAIRNKKSLAGVYGLYRDVSKAPKSAWADAEQAWKESLKGDCVDGATVWGTPADVKVFKTKEWFKKYEYLYRIGNHDFFREVK